MGPSEHQARLMLPLSPASKRLEKSLLGPDLEMKLQGHQERLGQVTHTQDGERKGRPAPE